MQVIDKLKEMQNNSQLREAVELSQLHSIVKTIEGAIKEINDEEINVKYSALLDIIEKKNDEIIQEDFKENKNQGDENE